MFLWLFEVFGWWMLAMAATSFLELPLDKELYKLKLCVPAHKPCLRVLVTNAGEKIAYNLIYTLCSGNVFGPDQQIILHLISSRGSIHHKAIVLELEECAFSVYKDAVVSSDPAVAYGKVDIVIAISTFEQMPGQTKANTITYQIVKAHQILRYVQKYAHSDAKVIFTGPSTKALTVLLSTFKKYLPDFPYRNVSCVTFLDVVIGKAHLAAKLKTTTDKIKNLVVWSVTYADIQNATVRMYPADDLGALEMKDVPIAKALGDEIWLYTTFGMSIYRRVINPDLVKYGKAVAQSTAQHLRFLLQGSAAFEEYVSMSVVTPSDNPYGVTPGIGFSFPVTTKNGQWEIIKDLEVDVPTKLNMMRVMFNYNGRLTNPAVRVLNVFFQCDPTQENPQTRSFANEMIESDHFVSNYFVVPNLAEWGESITKEQNRPLVKSILWNDEMGERGSVRTNLRSYTHFSSDTLQLEAGKYKKSYFPVQPEDIVSILTQKTPAKKDSK